MTAAAIDWGKLFELVWAAALASFAVATTFAVVIFGATRAADCRRGDRAVAAAAYATLAALAGLIFAAGVVFGVSIIVAK